MSYFRGNKIWEEEDEINWDVIEISKVEEAKAGPFTYVKLFLKNNKKHNIPPLDNQKEFINIINAKLHGT